MVIHTFYTLQTFKGNQMIQTVNNSAFHDAFNRMDRGNQFSYEALNLIYEYMESIESDTGEQIELDVIAICCEYSEQTWQEIAESYDIDLSDWETDEDKQQAVIDYINDHSMYIGVTDDGSIVYEQF